MSEPITGLEGMPAIPKETEEYIFSRFAKFLFFTTLKKGVREYKCSACHKTFNRGERVLLRIEKPEDIALYHAKHNSEAVCPLCGAKATVINSKLQNRSSQNIEISNAVVLFFALSENEVWARAVFFC